MDPGDGVIVAWQFKTQVYNTEGKNLTATFTLRSHKHRKMRITFQSNHFNQTISINPSRRQLLALQWNTNNNNTWSHALKTIKQGKHNHTYTLKCTITMAFQSLVMLIGGGFRIYAGRLQYTRIIINHVNPLTTNRETRIA